MRSAGSLLLVNNPIGYGEVYSNVNSYPTETETVTNTPAEPAQVGVENTRSNPLMFWLIAIGLFALVIVVARYSTPGEGFGEQFKNIRPSVFNIIFIALVAMVGLPLLKLGAAKVPNEGLRNYLLSV